MFDPYRKWLGILPKDQPPNHYRLLGVEVFEDDLDVIEGAADRQMGFVRQYQSGEHAAAAAKILNELAIARLCLLKPASKAAYDAKLRHILAAPEAKTAPEAAQLPFSVDEPATGLIMDSSASRYVAARRGGRWKVPVFGLVAVAIVSVFLLRNHFNTPVVKSKSTKQDRDEKLVTPKSSDSDASMPEDGMQVSPPDDTTVTTKTDVKAEPTAVTVIAQPQPTVATAKVETNLVPVPKVSETESARTRITKKLADEYKKAKTVEQMRAIAGKLRERAANPQESPVDRYACFLEACDQYVEIGDVLETFRVVDSMKSVFDIAAFELKTDLLQRVGKKAKNFLQNRFLVFVALKLAADAAAVEDYASAKEACNRAVAAAGHSAEGILQAYVRDQLRQYEGLLDQWQAMKLAEETLKEHPDEAGAHGKIGEYRCWVRRDWANGLPSLRHSTDPELKSIAIADLADPRLPKEQIALADQWLTFAKAQKSPVIKSAAAERAAAWFEKVIPSLSDPVRAAAQEEIETAYELACGREFTRLLSRVPNGIDAEKMVDCKANVIPLKLKPLFDIRKSWMLSLEFNPPKS